MEETRKEKSFVVFLSFLSSTSRASFGNELAFMTRWNSMLIICNRNETVHIIKCVHMVNFAPVLICLFNEWKKKKKQMWELMMMMRIYYLKMKKKKKKSFHVWEKNNSDLEFEIYEKKKRSLLTRSITIEFDLFQFTNWHTFHPKIMHKTE